MIDFDPAGQNRPQRHMKQPVDHPGTRRNARIAFDPAFVRSYTGIFLGFSIICAFLSFVTLEVGKTYFQPSTPIQIQEAFVITSCILNILFYAVCVLQIYRLKPVRTSIMKWIVTGFCLCWSLIIFMSSCILLDSAVIFYGPRTGIPSIETSGAFGLLEFIALGSVAVVQFLDLLEIRREPLFE